MPIKQYGSMTNSIIVQLQRAEKRISTGGGYMKNAYTSVSMILCCLLIAATAVMSHAADKPRGYVLRVRVLKLTPEQPVRIFWRWGGEGLGGGVSRGELTQQTPDSVAPATTPDATQPADRVIVRRNHVDYHYLQPGAWTEPASLSDAITRWRTSLVTLTMEGLNDGTKLRDTQIECEVSFAGRLVKTFTIDGPNGPTFGLYAPWSLLAKDGMLTEAFTRELGSLRDYATHRAEVVEQYPWAKQPGPQFYGMVADCGGYGEGANYGIRTTDPQTILAECRTLHAMGMNGFRAIPPFVQEAIRTKTGIGPEFSRIAIAGVIGYPAQGCPYDPKNREAMSDRIEDSVARLMDANRTMPYEEIWALTVDEIGSYFGSAPGGKAHMGLCPFCREAFREFVRKDGCTLQNFGAKSWDDIRPTYGYWTPEELAAEARKDAAVVDQLNPTPDGKPAASPPPKKTPDIPLPGAGRDLLWYYSARFDNEASAQLFEPVQKALAVENEQKRQALKRGDLNSPAARQPWVYSYALRGNTFLMGGGSLDFFDFYRYADNGFVYETSNRDSRVWNWDSYLCDVGRSVSRFMGKPLGIYVKPHRGAPIQRALTAAARGARMIYWYVYGPEWYKGDSFAAQPEAIEKVGRVSHMLARAEAVTYDASWAVPAEVALVRPRTAEIFGDAANWENGKWVYTALQHAHIPVDALDEGLLMSEDLSRYKAIVVSGSNLRRDVAQKLMQWVEAGGLLYTCGGGLRRDESNIPLSMLLPVFGVQGDMRPMPVRWADVPMYGATKLQGIIKTQTPPETARITAESVVTGSFQPEVGREILTVLPNTEVLARFGDGTPALIRHRYGKGTAVLAAFYAGLEYGIDTMNWRVFSSDKRSFITAPLLAAGIQPVVDAASPKVEGVLVRNNKSGKSAVFLMDWLFEPRANLTVNIRGIGEFTKVRSAALDQEVPWTRTPTGVQVVVPTMEDGDILLFE